MPSFTADQLRAGLETLPQEIYDEIFNLTFAYHHDQYLIIDDDYKPPFQLQINREIRKKFVGQFYGHPLQVRARGKNAFMQAKSLETASASAVGLSITELLRCWLHSLPEDALAAVRHSLLGSKDRGYHGRVHFRAGWNDTISYTTKWRVHPGSKMGVRHDVLEIVKLANTTIENEETIRMLTGQDIGLRYDVRR